MNFHDFILSEKISVRLSRHILYWSLLYIFYALLAGSVYITELNFENPFNVKDLLHELNKSSFSQRLGGTFIDFIEKIIYCYLIVYWLLPNYLTRKKSLAFWFWVIVLTLISEVITLYHWGLRLHTPFNEAVTMLWMAALNFVNTGPLIFCGLFIAIKMAKNWYTKEEEKLTLIHENANAELQLLKAQIHPHFLFNTLNNIYSFALNQSSKAPDLVSKLTDILKYMINDCQASSVSVEKEIKMIEDYIGLEKVRYGNQLSLEIKISGDPQNKFMAPLLLIPFVENSFKHGSGKMLTNSWIKLNIDWSDDSLHFTLSNSKPLHNGEKNINKGIGLNNVRKRLQLLYPNQHDLNLESQKEVFTVKLNIPLHAYVNQPDSTRMLSIESTESAYAGV